MSTTDRLDWTSPEVWHGTRQPLERATGLHPEAYTSVTYFEREQELVFGRAWACIGTTDEVAERGRLLVRQIGRQSIIVTRDRDGLLRGFRNSCRHRGTELAAHDCDTGDTIRCPYHRWGYSLDGALIATPLFDQDSRSDFDRTDHGLLDVRVDSWGVLLFACLSPDTMPLQAWLGDLPERMGGYGLESWQARHRQVIGIDANWKLISENFQEYYHLGWVHPELAKVSRTADHYRYQGPGMYCGQTTTPVSAESRDEWSAMPPAERLDESDSISGRFVAIFPNVLLSVLPNHAWVMRLDPTGSDRTSESCTLLVPPHADGSGTSSDGDACHDNHGDIRPTLDFWLDINDEDIDIVGRSQRGLSGGAAPAGPLAPRFEEPLHRFHNMLADHFVGPGVTVPRGDRPGHEADRRGTGPNPNPPAIDRSPTA